MVHVGCGKVGVQRYSGKTATLGADRAAPRKKGLDARDGGGAPRSDPGPIKAWHTHRDVRSGADLWDGIGTRYLVGPLRRSGVEKAQWLRPPVGAAKPAETGPFDSLRRP